MEEQGETEGVRGVLAQRAVPVLGMTMLWPFIHNQLMFPASFSFPFDGAPPAHLLYFAYMAIFLAACTVVALNGDRLSARLFCNGRAMAVVGLVGALGTGLICFGGYGSTPAVVAASVGYALVACYVPLAFAYWCRRLVALGDGTFAQGHVVAAATACSYVVFCLLTALRLALGISSSYVTVAFCLIAAGLALVVDRLPQRQLPEGEAHVRQLPVNLVVPSLVFVYICVFVIALLNPAVALYDYPQQRAFMYWIDAVLMTVSAVVFVRMPNANRRASMVVFAIFSVYLIGVILLTAASAIRSFITANFLVIAGKNAFDFLVLLLVLVGSHNRHVDPVRHVVLFLVVAYAVPSILSTVTLLLGGLYTDPLEGSFTILAVMLATAFVVAVIANVALVAFLSRRGRLADADEAPRKPKPDDSFELARAAWGLTDREAEIAAAVCTNATTTKIARDFSISEATVYSHLKRIYRKADVHSRQELIDLVETFKK